jgi:superfamily II DNA or RNA helicase
LSQSTPASPERGQVVHVRQRTWLVTDVQSDVVDLSCLDDDAAGDTAQVLWDLEPGARIAADAGGLKRPAALDDPRKFAAYLSALRWHAVTSTDKRLLQAPFRAGIDLMAYQLEPLRKALELPRVNLFIADDVGLGKTIEAGLILQELLLRQRIDRVLVVCPPAVTLQWQEELDQRFGLTFHLYDKDYVNDRRRERGWKVNPWTTARHFIVSTTRLRGQRSRKRKGVPRVDHLEELLNVLRDESNARTGKVERSLLIFDEAHHAAPSSKGSWGIDSRTTKAMRSLAERFEHRLFLSATPHNGLSNSFSALLELLDPQRFTRATPVTGANELAPVMVRRLKKHLRTEVSGLPERILVDHTIEQDDDDPELVLGALLAEYDAAYKATLADLPPAQQAARGLVLIRLHKHLLSSIAAFESTLKVHARSIRTRLEAASASPTSAAAPLPEADDDQSELALAEAEDLTETEARADDEMEAATLAPNVQALALLDKLQTVASAHAQQPDARMRELATWIKANLLTPTGEWKPTRLVVFTEFEPTLRWLQLRLPGLLSAADLEKRFDIYSGLQGDERRQQLKASFNRNPAKDPLRILLCTDAAREGLNLQAYCHHLFHFDLPWNPARVEQRNGRIDRKLQKQPQVFCHYFNLPQRPEDKVLTYMVKRIRTIADELGSLSGVLSARLAARFDKVGLRGATQRMVLQTLTPDDRAVQAAKALESRYEGDSTALRGDLALLERQMDRSKKAVGYDADQLRHAVDLGLRMVCGHGLSAIEPPTDPPAWRLPVKQLDATWASTLAPLREAADPDAPHWHLPKVRPVAFKAAHQLDADTVQLHLGHPVVKRLLARFRAQGFAAHDLERVTLMHTPNESVRRVVLLGKLSLFGHGATRLHEELVTVAGQWSADSAPTPYKANALRTAEAVLDAAIAGGSPTHPDPQASKRAIKKVDRDVRALMPALEQLGAEREAQAAELLTKRGEAEATEMVEILNRQHQKILEAQANGQLPFQFSTAEKSQYELDVRALAKRLDQLEKERTVEPEAIRRSYQITLRRFEPVGLVYLWPGSAS